MTLENRADEVVCPRCDNNPIVQDSELYFCDMCNKEFERTELVQIN